MGFLVFSKGGDLVDVRQYFRLAEKRAKDCLLEEMIAEYEESIKLCGLNPDTISVWDLSYITGAIKDNKELSPDAFCEWRKTVMDEWFDLLCEIESYAEHMYNGRVSLCNDYKDLYDWCNDEWERLFDKNASILAETERLLDERGRLLDERGDIIKMWKDLYGIVRDKCPGCGKKLGADADSICKNGYTCTCGYVIESDDEIEVKFESYEGDDEKC